MSKSPLLDRRGQPMTTYTATDAKNAFGEVLEKASAYGAVAITRHDKPRYVLLSIDEYQAGNAARSDALKAFSARYDAMFDEMQSQDPARINEALFGRKAKRGRKRG